MNVINQIYFATLSEYKGDSQSSSPCDVVFSSYALSEQVRTALKEKKPKLTSLSFVARARFELAASGL